MTEEKLFYDLLRRMIEQSVGRTMQSPTDFEVLRDKISERCGITLSDSTLKRFWGYVRSYDKVRISTLDSLARFVGFAGWDGFVEYAEKGGETSDFVMGGSLKAADLVAGDAVTVVYPPDRCCVFCRTEDGFVVEQSKNSKLKEGDVFKCDVFIVGEPCYLYDLSHEGKDGLTYVIGKSNGLTSVKKGR